MAFCRRHAFPPGRAPPRQSHALVKIFCPLNRAPLNATADRELCSRSSFSRRVVVIDDGDRSVALVAIHRANLVFFMLRVAALGIVASAVEKPYAVGADTSTRTAIKRCEVATPTISLGGGGQERGGGGTRLSFVFVTPLRRRRRRFVPAPPLEQYPRPFHPALPLRLRAVSRAPRGCLPRALSRQVLCW